MRIRRLISFFIPLLGAIAPLHGQATTPGQGLDSFDEKRVMIEMANHGMKTLLQRNFELNKTPASQQTAFLTLLSVHSLTDTTATLSPAQWQDLIEGIANQIDSALPAIRDPATLIQIAKVLVTNGVDPQVNALEYWGENPKTQSQLRPLVEAVMKIYKQARTEAGRRADEIADHLNPNDEAAAKVWQTADELRTLAIYGMNMATYDLCLSMDKADPNRRPAADAAIKALDQFDNNDTAVQTAVRNRIAKLNMAKGDYTTARKIFKTVIDNPDGQIKPPPDVAQQYEARYFSIVCQILSHDLTSAGHEMDALGDWQKTQLAPPQRLAAAAAFDILRYRVLSTKADVDTDAAARAKDNDEAMEILVQLLKDYPQYKTVVFQQVITRLPDNADITSLSPVALMAIQQQGEQQYRKSQGQKVDEQVMNRAIAAANEILKRKGQPGIDETAGQRSAYVIPYLLDKLGRKKEAATAFLDFAQQFPTDTKDANDALDQATAIIAQLRKQDLQDDDTRKLYDRFLPIAIASPYNRRQFALEYALLLQREQKYKQAVEYFHLVPADDPRIVSAHFYEMVSLKQRLDDDNDKMSAADRQQIMSQIQTLADQVSQGASAAQSAATVDADKKRYASMLVRTALLAADLSGNQQKNPQRTLDLLSGFEAKVAGLPEEKDLLFEALFLRVNAYMALGQTDNGTNALVQLLKTKQGDEGPSLVFDMLKKLEADMEHARAAGDMQELKQLAQNRAALSGFLVTWAANNSDPNIKALTKRYTIFDASTKQLAAELTDDPAAKKSQLAIVLKQYQDLYDPNAPDPTVQLGLGFVQYDLGDYKAAIEMLGPLVSNKKIGTPTMTITENGEPKTVDNPQYWEAILKLVRSIVEVAHQNPDDAQASQNLKDAQTFLQQQYVLWPKTIGGAKYHDDFEKLRAEIIPDFKPVD